MDLSALGDSVHVDVSKDDVEFVNDGEGMDGSVLLKQTDAARKQYVGFYDDDELPGAKDDDEDEEAQDGEGAKKKKSKT